MALNLLLFGFLIGMRHAVEGDHAAAVATLAARSSSVGDTVRQGAVWGLGHTLTLFAVGWAVLSLDLIMAERLVLALEFLVGLMLVVLGADLLRRLFRERIHRCRHRHADGAIRCHGHSPAGEKGRDPDRHRPAHRRGFPLRALLVGLVHGMAGSAPLILLTVQNAQSPGLGLLYIALFGLGSIVGMAVLSLIIAVPLRASARGLGWLHDGLQAVIGAATVSLGAWLVHDIGWRQGLLAL